ncbi:MAG: hypothetical protein Q9M40_09995 [Sulfurimonas sp.]|nr:hypothetical protein [Sulfurimonas sp.]
MHKHEHEHDHHLTVSPYPSANEIEKLHDINPGFFSNTNEYYCKKSNDADIETR